MEKVLTKFFYGDKKTLWLIALLYRGKDLLWVESPRYANVFSLNRPLGGFSLVVAMSVCVCVYVMSSGPIH